jgi:hypothetical protein
MLGFALATADARGEFHRGNVYPTVSGWQARWLGGIVMPCC